MSRPPLAWWGYGIALAPLVVAVVGGAVGVAVGGAGAAANLVVARRVGGMALASVSLVMTGVAFLAWATLVVALR